MTHDEAVHLLSARIDGPLAGRPAAVSRRLARRVRRPPGPGGSVPDPARRIADGVRATARRRRPDRRGRRSATGGTASPVVPAGGAAGGGDSSSAPLPAACAAAVLDRIWAHPFRGTNSTAAAPDRRRERSIGRQLVGLGLHARPKPEAPEDRRLGRRARQLATKAGREAARLAAGRLVSVPEPEHDRGARGTIGT